MDQTKKISFGFTKQIKKSNIILNKTVENKTAVENKVQLIECLEGNSIKLLNEDKNEKESPLIIPVQQNRTTATALASLKLRQAVLNNIEENKSSDQEITTNNEIKKNSNENIDINESLEKKAARELLEEIRNKEQNSQLDITVTVPLKPDELPLDGAEEPNVDDYEKIPISQFGLAMLRGMGWKDEQQKKDKLGDNDQPILRPKGMGLGADKVLKSKPALVAPEKNEKLEIKKNAYVRILGGKHKDLYGQIEGLDDHAGRVIVKLALGGSRESLNEFLVQPVSKGEYTKYGKVINSVKYEEYKRMQEIEQRKKVQEVKHENDMEIYDKKKIKKEIDIENMKKEIKTEKADKYEFEYKNTVSSSNNSKYDSSRRSKTYYDDGELNSHRIKKERKGETSKDRHIDSRSSSKSSIEESHRSKKKSHKSKKHRNQRQQRNDSSEDDKRHKKKTKKSKKARSRSRGRR